MSVEEITADFVRLIRQIVPSYQRRILTFLAKNKGVGMTNSQIARALDEDRSNIWRFMNNIIVESRGRAPIKREKINGEILYRWNEPEIKINNFNISELLLTLEKLEKKNG